ncbi:MAG TPA: hypothetical protein VFR10_10995 [bacterium]|nr:hypothetical protein [bacterium]
MKPNTTRCILLLIAASMTFAPATRAVEKLVDAPIVWYEDDRVLFEQLPHEREPSVAKDQFTQTVIRPLQRNTRFSNVTRRVGSLFGGDHVMPAANINTLGEVPNSTWFTNRIGLFPVSLEEAARGPGEGDGPDTSGVWTVVSAKTEGVTPGFNIKDPKGDTYLIKFDPFGYPGLTTVPGAIVGRIFNAAGYNVPDDAVVTFRREQLVLGKDVSIRVREGINQTVIKRKMVEGDLDRILERVDQVSPGEYLAISSKFLDGKPIGPFDYKGRRHDDPNDHIRHEDRRELRGLRIFCAWLHHFDTKQHNSLDTFVKVDGEKGYIRHHLIDFASTLGAGANGPKAKYGREYGVDLPQIFGRMFAVGLKEDDWRRVEEEYPADNLVKYVGYYDTEYFHPKGFKPLLPNTSFASMTDDDGYWAAKIISAFTDAHLAAIGNVPHAPSQEAVQYLITILAKRRDIIAREWFTRIPPADFFRMEGTWKEDEVVPVVSSDPLKGFVSLNEGGVDAQLVGRDLGVERGIWPAERTTWQVRCAVVDENRDPEVWSGWQKVEMESNGHMTVTLAEGSAALALATALPSKRPFMAFELQVDRGEGWSNSIFVYAARRSGRIVAVDR